LFELVVAAGTAVIAVGGSEYLDVGADADFGGEIADVGSALVVASGGSEDADWALCLRSRT
jgi:hypothetical protein